MRPRPPTDRAPFRAPGPKDTALGLDELMIVNPTPDAAGGIFLGEDGTLYQVQGVGAEELPASGPLFLGDDGTLYRAERGAEPAAAGAEPAASPTSASPPGAAGGAQLGGYVLAADGTLYEVSA